LSSVQPSVQSSLEGQILTITLNRPGRLNAVSSGLYEGIIDAFDQSSTDPGVRAVVMTGSGRAFCVGADLKAHGDGNRTPEQIAAYVQLGQDVCERIQTASVPVIAAVHGYALGAGAEMATSADFLVMAEDAQMGFPEVSIGTFIGGGVTHRLPRLVGLRRASELLIQGDRFTGRQAAEWGLANFSVPSGEALTAALSLAQRLVSNAPRSMGLVKEALNRDDSLATALTSEAANLLAVMQTQDWAEGVAAFAERRAPTFVGR